MKNPAGALALLTISIEQRLERGYTQLANLSDAVLELDRAPDCACDGCAEIRESVSGLLARMVVGFEESKCAWHGYLLPEMRRIVSLLHDYE